MTAEPTPLHARAGLPDVAGDHLNARRFLAEHGLHLRRSPELRQWYLWNGAWWEDDRLDRVPEIAATTIDGLRRWVAEAPSPQEHALRSRHYQASTKAGRRDALLSVAGTDPSVVVAVDQLDDHALLLACQNGTVDLTTGELRMADPADLITRGIDVDYDPDAFSDVWVAFLDEIFRGDVELIEYVQRLLGYCLTGVVHEHVVPVLTGTGANGKSTLLGVVQDLLGDHAITAPEGLVIQRGHEPHPERLAILRGRRLVISTELEESAVLAEGVVKMLSGADTISARELYGRRFNFRPTHKILLVTNHCPKVHGVDHAIWRRLLVVPFDVTIAPERQDPDLRRRLVEEHGSAVLAWLVEGAIAWKRDGIGTAEAVRAATLEYRASQDVLGAWLDEHTERDAKARTKVGELFNAWRSWCQEQGESPGRSQDFAGALRARGVELVTHQGNRLARGIVLAVRAREGSSRDFSNSSSTGTVLVRPHEASPSEPSPSDDDLARMFGEGS